MSEEEVRIIRCKDCDFWVDKLEVVDKNRKPIKRLCLNLGTCTDKDFYCGWGSRDE